MTVAFVAIFHGMVNEVPSLMSVLLSSPLLSLIVELPANRKKSPPRPRGKNVLTWQPLQSTGI